MTVDVNGEYKFSPVILFLDRAPEESRQFYVIKTDAGHTLTLTPSHLIYSKSGIDDEYILQSDTISSELRTNMIDTYENNKGKEEEISKETKSDEQLSNFLSINSFRQFVDLFYLQTVSYPVD